MKRSWILNVTAVAAATMFASTAQAQAFNFWTEGQFTSGVGSCTSGRAMTVVCDDPGTDLTLTFNGRNWTDDQPFGFLSGSQVTLGDFVTGGNGERDVPGGAVNFTLYINQTMPTTGEGSAVGFISGTLILPVAGASFSTLIWQPNEFVVIDQVTYDLIFREQPGIVLTAGAQTTIEAIATVVPEPSTYLLMASGLAGLYLVGRRKRNA